MKVQNKRGFYLIPDIDSELTIGLENLNLRIKPYRLPKRAPMLESLMHDRGVIKDYRAVAMLGNDDYDDDVASCYSPEKLQASILKYFTNREKAKFTWNEEAKEALSDVYRAFKPVKKLTALELNFENVSRVLKHDTSSGYPLYQKKGVVLEYTYQRALDVAQRKRQPGPCTSGIRTQREGSQTSSKVRLIWAFPAEMTALEGLFARPAIDYFVSYNIHPIAFGMSKTQLADKLTPISNRNYRYSIDYSGFDSTVSTKAIKLMFNVVKSWFEDMSPELEDIFDQVIDNFLKAKLLTPWGIINTGKGGIKSGSYFTQLIGSLYNYFLISYALRVQNLRPVKNLTYVLGDDCIIGSAYKILTFKKVETDFGVKVNLDKTEVTTFGERIHFLGRYYQYGLAHGDPKESRTKFVYPENSRMLEKYQLPLVAASYLFEHAENAEWIFKATHIRPGHPLSYAQFVPAWKVGHNADLLSIRKGLSRQLLMLDMEGRKVQMFPETTLLA